MTAFANVWHSLDWSVLSGILFSIVPALICITLHELSHGAVAYLLGDDTAKNAGRLTLNPIRHIDPWGLVMMVLFHFGWAKPVPVNMYRFKDPKKGMAITALAGPVSNMIIAVVFLFLGGLLYGLAAVHWPTLTGGRWASVTGGVLEMVMTTAYLSIALAVFNLIPISPLDGSKVLYSFLSDQAYAKLMRYERYGMIIIMLLVITGSLSGVLGSVTGWVYDKLFVIADIGFRLVSS